MNYQTKDMRAALQAADICRAFAAWLATEGDRLSSAAMLLGGPTWERRAEAVAAAIRQGASPGDVEADSLLCIDC